MSSSTKKLPSGHSDQADTLIHSSAELGALVRDQRKRLALKQIDIAGLSGTGNRFIVDLENGKPTVQLQKALDVIALLGLEIVVRPKRAGSLG
ncbi:helix-turn-helix transcriptional regulator [Burkholderia alba]|uniref:helix-turn-helix transcriptional regulator n=1 Tax=Burkholderia alba TaxID=2683677 RepID=UPI002B057A20|nr:helix-turn-helix transcriptional regulator [Burkholderia alba]